MEIANPIYDAVFKFMMEDQKVARLLIGAITRLDIQSVALRPTEIVTDEDGHRQWTVYRLDLAAHVRTPQGLRVVVVEIQKAKYYTDIMRFRRYLGSQYVSSENYEKVMDNKGREVLRGMPIVSIYILGYHLACNADVPVIEVNRRYTDRNSGKELAERDEFIESLTHDSVIIQVPALTARRRNRLEKILGVFDQAQIKPENRHLLQIADTEYPEECQVLIRRLMEAIADAEVRKRMIVEDEIISELELRDRREQELAEQVQEERRKVKDERRKVEEERRQKREAQAEIAKLKRRLKELEGNN